MKPAALRHLLLLRAYTLRSSGPAFAEAVKTLTIDQDGEVFRIGWRTSGEAQKLDWPVQEFQFYSRGDVAGAARPDATRWLNWEAARRLWCAIAEKSGFTFEETGDPSPITTSAPVARVLSWCVTVLVLATALSFCTTWPSALRVLLAGTGLILGAIFWPPAGRVPRIFTMPLAALGVFAVPAIPHGTAYPEVLVLALGVLTATSGASGAAPWIRLSAFLAAGAALGLVASGASVGLGLAALAATAGFGLTGLLFPFLGLRRGALLFATAFIATGVAGALVMPAVTEAIDAGGWLPLATSAAAVPLTVALLFCLFSHGTMTEHPAAAAVTFAVLIAALATITGDAPDSATFVAIMMGLVVSGLLFLNQSTFKNLLLKIPAAIRFVADSPRFVALFLVPIAFIGLKFFQTSLGGESGVLLSFPISIEYLSPGTYPDSDLLTYYGIRTPFYFYKWTGLLEPFVPLVNLYSFLSVTTAFSQSWAVWYVATAVLPQRAAAALVVGVLMLTDYFTGTINYSAFPNPGIVSQTAALPFVFAAIGLALRKSYSLSAIFLGIGLFLHPGATLISSVIVFMAALVDAEHRWRALARMAVILGAFVTFFSFGYATETKAPLSDDLARLIPIWQIHAYFEKHLETGYAPFALMLAIALWFERTIVMTPHIRKTLRLSILAFVALPVAYSINLYTVFWPPEVLQLYLFRTTFVLKILCYMLIVGGIASVLRRDGMPQRLKAAVVLLAGALLLNIFDSPFTSTMITRNLWIGLSLLAVLSLWRVTETPVAEAGLPHPEPPLACFAGIAVTGLLILHVFGSSPRTPIWLLLCGAWGLAFVHARSHGLIRWRTAAIVAAMGVATGLLAILAALGTNAVAFAPFPIIDIAAALGNGGLDRLRLLNLAGSAAAVVWLAVERPWRTPVAQLPSASPSAATELPAFASRWVVVALTIIACTGIVDGFLHRPNARNLVAEAVGVQAEQRRHLVGLTAWLRDNTPKASMILADPVAQEPLAIRYLARRGLWISTTEFNQYTYHFGAYRKAADRLADLGIQMRPNREFDYVFDNGFLRMRPSELFAYARDNGIDYVLIDHNKDHRDFGRDPVYQDSFYTLYTVK